MMSVDTILRSLQDDGDDVQNEKGSTNLTSDPMVWTLIWVGVLLLILVCPFLSNKRRRTLCYKRCIERHWNISNEEGDDDNMTFIPHERIVRKYPVGDPRHKLTPEEAEEETKKYILNKLEPYSKVLSLDDFDCSNDIEGQTAHSFCTSSDQLSNESANNSSGDLSTMNKSKISDMTNVMLKVPPPGVSLKDYERAQKTNQVPDNEISMMSERVVSRKGEETRYQDNECSICLGNFSEGETVSWSALDCEHIFHQDCLLNWLMTLGQKSIGNRNGNTIMQVHLCRYSMKCPNCRQDFIPKAK